MKISPRIVFKHIGWSRKIANAQSKPAKAALLLTYSVTKRIKSILVLVLSCGIRQYFQGFSLRKALISLAAWQ